MRSFSKCEKLQVKLSDNDRCESYARRQANDSVRDGYSSRGHVMLRWNYWLDAAMEGVPRASH